MHLVKWFRKNMNKLMAIIVILIMIAFIMPSVLSQLAKPRSKGPTRAMWYFDKDKKISFNDIGQAARELAAMRSLYVDKFFITQQDLRFVLLGQLLFPESVPGAALSDEIKGIVMQSQLYISPGRIDAFFEQAGGRAELFWILLKAEAKNAGCAVSPQHAGEILKALIPKITSDRIDAQTAVRNAGQANQMTDDMVLATFADILAVISYARIVTDTEDVTEMQMAALAARTKETVNAEFVGFSNEKFIDKTSEPDKTEIALQFEKYKNYYPNIITEENPCGFGYKQKPRVALEYMIVKLEDVKKLVTQPTEEETEEFYQQNLNRFSEQVPADANDPNSKITERQRSYAQVAGAIKNALLARKAGTKAIKILEDAVEQAQAGFESLNFETASVQQFKEKTTDYADAAEKIAQQNDIKIYTGKTALLTVEEIVADRCLGSLLMRTQSRIPTGLARMVFAIEQLGDEAFKLGPFEPPKPKMFVSIGPFTDSMGTIVAMARVIETKNSTVPTDINFSYEKSLPIVFEDDRQQEEKTFVLKEKVKQDCRKLAAFEKARQKANEFVELAKSKGWEAAIEKFNSLYPARDGNENQKNFEIQSWKQKGRISQTDIEAAKLSTPQLPGAERFVNQSIIYAKLIDEFYSLFKSNQTQAENVPAIIEFKPQLACYVIKSLSRSPATIEDYEQSRQQIAYKENYILSQSMTLEHFMPDNILKRLNLRPAYEPNKPAEKTETDANGA